MKPKHLTVGALALAVAPLAALSNGAAPGITGESDADVARGGDAYDRVCVICHANPAVILRQIPGDDMEMRAASLDTFLSEHYAPDEEIRRDIIAWLLSL